MSYEFDVVEIEPVTLALTEAAMELADIPARIIGMFDVVYAWSREVGAEQTGQNYALYREHPSGILMQVGFPVLRSSPETDLVKCVDFTACKAAHTTHVGEYAGLPAAHAKLRAWCDEQALSTGELDWEVYGDWNDDPSQVNTEVYVKLDTPSG